MNGMEDVDNKPREIVRKKTEEFYISYCLVLLETCKILVLVQGQRRMRYSE